MDGNEEKGLKGNEEGIVVSSMEKVICVEMEMARDSEESVRVSEASVP